MFKTNDNRYTNLTTDRLLLRPLNETDQDTVFRLRSDDLVNQYLDRPPCLSPEDAIHFIQAIQHKITIRESMYWAISLKETDTLIGTICLFHFSEDLQIAEIGFELMPVYQGKGFMQEALTAILTLSFEVLKIHTIAAVTHMNNHPCIFLLQKNNFKMIPEYEIKNNTAPANFISFQIQQPKYKFRPS